MKKTIKAIIGVAVLGGVFYVGGVTGATNDWSVQVSNTADKRIGAAGFNTKEELLKDPNEISDTMVEVADPYISEYEKELESMLKEYYQMKVDGLVETQKFKDLEKRMEQIKQQVFDRYKKEIDKAVQ